MPTKPAKDLKLGDMLIWSSYRSEVIAHRKIGRDRIEIMERWTNRFEKVRCTPRILHEDRIVTIEGDEDGRRLEASPRLF